MRNPLSIAVCTSVILLFSSCNSNSSEKDNSSPQTSTAGAINKGQSSVKDELSQKNVVQVAMGSKDHSTLVKAIEQAGLVDALSNAGPFTVFAPTNEAFEKLPPGTLEGLLKPEKKDALTDILQYHVSIGVFKENMMTDGQTIGQVNGGNITISKKDGKLMVNGTANVVATVPASNGVIYVIDQVLLPK